MSERDPIDALTARYAEIDECEAPETLSARKPAAGLSTELLKLASACAAGVAIVFASTNSSVPTPASVPAQMTQSAQIEGLRREIVECGLDPDEILGTPPRHGERTGGRKWRA